MMLHLARKLSINELLKTAEEFSSISSAKTIDLIKNNQEILAEISDAKDFKKRIKIAEDNFDKLGEGSSRTIFQMSDSLVLKVAHSDKGIAQNSAELSMRAPCLNNVLAADPEAKWIIVRFTDTLHEDEFKEAVGFSFKPFISAISWNFNNEIHEGKPQEYDEIIETHLFKCLSKLVLDNQLQIGDIGKLSSWGFLDGKPLLRDFGLTKDIYAEHYKDDNDASDSGSALSVETDTDSSKSSS